MKREIKDIWIESEERGPILGGTAGINDNSDVIVTFSDDSRHVATFFTYQNIEHLRQKNRKTGECLSGKFFWASPMIIVDRIEREEIEGVIKHLISEDEFGLIFNQLEVETHTVPNKTYNE